MFTQLAGARTYLLAIAGAIVATYMAVDDLVTFLGVANLPDVPTYIMVLIGSGAAASLRAAK